jgi:hypothetical protein
MVASFIAHISPDKISGSAKIVDFFVWLATCASFPPDFQSFASEYRKVVWGFYNANVQKHSLNARLHCKFFFAKKLLFLLYPMIF